MNDTLPAWAMERAREALFETSPEGPTLRDDFIGFVARALVAADKAATERERDRCASEISDFAMKHEISDGDRPNSGEWHRGYSAARNRIRRACTAIRNKDTTP